MDDVEKQKHAAAIEPWTIKLHNKKTLKVLEWKCR